MVDFRPQMHFTPARNWLNDPNGLIQLDGTYHLYFQHNPNGDQPGDISWGHATSTDLVHWQEHPLALRYDDREQIFSGSVVLDSADTSGLGLDGRAPLVAVYTSDRRDKASEAQSLAVSHDGGFTWTPYPDNPVLDRGTHEFRDPKVFWYDGPAGAYWVMVVIEAADRQVLIYRSDNLRDWVHLSTFGPANATTGLWECPDLFPLPVDGDPDDVRWVLVVSLSSGRPGGGSATQYFVGDFDGVTFTAPDLGESGALWLDHGPDFYAAVSFGNVADGRRLVIGWMSSWEYASGTPTSPWRGAMTLVRELRLRIIGGTLRLTQHLLDAFEGPSVAHPGALEVPLEPLAQRIDVTVEPRGPFGLVLHAGADERTLLTYEDGVLRLDRRASGRIPVHPTFPSVQSVPVDLVDGRLRLTLYVDRCSLEVVAQDGLVTLTTLIFPTTPVDRLVLDTAAELLTVTR